MKTYGPSRAIAWSASTGGMTKLGLVGLTMLLGLALTLASAEASGDPYGDAYGSTGNVDGALANVAGAADGTIVQVGAAGSGGALIVAYTDNIAFDGAGADIRVHTLDLEAPAEASIEVSDDGMNFVSAGDFFDDVGAIDIDLAALGLTFATTVRVTYVSGVQPGFDVDAIEALNQIGTEGAGISLAPAANADPGFTEHEVVATVTDSTTTGDVPIAGIQVTFAVISGPTSGASGVASTDGLGDAAFGWAGAAPGIDEVVAWLDVDGSGTRDEGEPSSEATKLWFGDTGTVELTDLDGGDLALDDLIEVAVEDRDLDVSSAVDTTIVTISSTSDPIGIAVLLTETGPRTGRFTAVVELAETSDEPAVALSAAVGDLVTVSYDDVVDEAGADPAAVTASLEVVVAVEADATERSDEGKVTVCHRPPGNPANQRTLTVGEGALDAHLGHGDLEGDCADVDVGEDDEPLSKREQAEARQAERDEAFCERKGDDHPRCRD